MYLDECNQVVTTDKHISQEDDSDSEDLPLSRLLKITSDQNITIQEVIPEEVPDASNIQEYNNDPEDLLPSRLVKRTSDQNTGNIQVISDIQLRAPNAKYIQEDPKPKLKRKNKAVSKDWIVNKNRKLRMK